VPLPKVWLFRPQDRLRRSFTFTLNKAIFTSDNVLGLFFGEVHAPDGQGKNPNQANIALLVDILLGEFTNFVA
jgi:hypothetical protein